MRKNGLVLATGALGLGLVLLLHWQVFFWVGTERTMGIIQRIFYIHVPAFWVAFMAFAVVAVCSGVYLWLKDERLDAAAVSAAEGGMLFTTVGLIGGSLWARQAWGTWWEWDARLVLTLLLWFIYLGYFMVRAAAESPDKARRLSAVVGIVGALTLPINHMSVRWWPFIHPQPVIANPEGSTADPDMTITLFTGLAALTFLFWCLWALRYRLERALAALESRRAGARGVEEPVR